MKQSILRILPGLALVLALAIPIHFVHQETPKYFQKVLGEAVCGIALGLCISNLFSLSSSWKEGIRFCFGNVLKFAIILLGVRISFEKIIEIGGGALFLIVGLIVLALWLSYQLGKWMQISPKLATLIGVGTAVCGNTAISAIAPAIEAKDEEMSFAIAVNTLFGTLAVFLYPLMGEYLQLSDTFFGFWAGTAINDTSQVVAAGFSYSPEAGNWATTVKLTRNALMGFVIVGVTLLHSSETNSDTEKKSWWKNIKLPGFILLFLLVAAVNSLGFFQWISNNGYPHLVSHINKLTQFLILIALVAVGLNTRFTSMKKIGWRPFFVGFATASVISITSFSLIHFFRLG